MTSPTRNRYYLAHLGTWDSIDGTVWMQLAGRPLDFWSARSVADLIHLAPLEETMGIRWFGVAWCWDCEWHEPPAAREEGWRDTRYLHDPDPVPCLLWRRHV